MRRRILGRKMALFTFIGDMLKGIIAVFIGKALVGGNLGGVLGVVGAVLGHYYPLYFGFKGGKGIATSFGSLLFVFPIQALLAFTVFLILVAVTHYVSVGSVAAAFTLPLLVQIGCEKAAVPMLVLQTIAANLGSMATPVGNPQNLFLYAAYGLSAGEFFSTVLPLTAVSLICLIAAALPVLPKQLPDYQLDRVGLEQPKKLAVYGILFVLCLLTVFRVLHFGVLTALVLIAIAIIEPKQLKHLDFALLATFVCFFVVSGNLGRVDAVRSFLHNLLSANPLLTAVGTSQVISNVPAAVLLSGFTDQWKPLLQGVNIGGLGTPIASLASLITLKLYLRWPGAKAGRFIAVFTLANVIGLIVLLAFAAI